jgi:hypothetical protein
MGTLFGFAVGYILGARAGQDGYEELVRSVRAIRASDEFQDFVVAMKEHGRHLLRQATGRLAGEEHDEAMAAFGNGDHRPRMPF